MSQSLRQPFQPVERDYVGWSQSECRFQWVRETGVWAVLSETSK